MIAAPRTLQRVRDYIEGHLTGHTELETPADGEPDANRRTLLGLPFLATAATLAPFATAATLVPLPATAATQPPNTYTEPLGTRSPTSGTRRSRPTIRMGQGNPSPMTPRSSRTLSPMTPAKSTERARWRRNAIACRRRRRHGLRRLPILVRRSQLDSLKCAAISTPIGAASAPTSATRSSRSSRIGWQKPDSVRAPRLCGRPHPVGRLLSALPRSALFARHREISV
jgi:hypothetical protein